MEDQRSIKKCEEISFGPATEIPFQQEQFIRLVERLEAGLKESLKNIKDEKVRSLLVQNIGHELEQLKNSQKPEQLFKYLSISYDHPNSLIDYFPKDSICFIDEISRVQEMNESPKEKKPSGIQVY